MALTIVATPGAESANSYVTPPEADGFVEAMVLNDDVTKWATSTQDNKNRALATAAQRLDRERFLGARATDGQAMEWPREGVRKPDTYYTSYSSGFPFQRENAFFGIDEIPDQIKHAQIELAVYLNNNPEAIGVTGLAEYKKVRIGSLEVEPLQYGAIGADNVPPMFERYLTGLRISGPGNIAIRRS